MREGRPGDGAAERTRFHVAFPVHDLDAARAFYVGLLGCREGRSASRWVDFDLEGHQLSAHLVEAGEAEPPTNPVDGDAVPVRHFGVILPSGRWSELADRLGAAEVPFLVPPRTRFAGLAGEQSTLFVRDPSGNALEFKSFGDETRIFARDDA